MRERVLTILGVIAVVGVVVYPLAHRISTSQASATAPPASVDLATSSQTASPSATVPPPATPTAVVAAAGPWDATAEEHRGAEGVFFTYECPAGGTPGDLWGVFRYTDHSSVCTAAVHMGIITFDDGGTIDISVLVGADRYEGVNQHGVQSRSYPAWPGSFTVVAPAR